MKENEGNPYPIAEQINGLILSKYGIFDSSVTYTVGFTALKSVQSIHQDEAVSCMLAAQ
jgi:hypothetical protein